MANIFDKILKLARNTLSRSQREMGSLLKISSSAYAKWEQGVSVPEIERREQVLFLVIQELCKVFKVLNLHTGELITRSDEKANTRDKDTISNKFTSGKLDTSIYNKAKGNLDKGNLDLYIYLGLGEIDKKLDTLIDKAQKPRRTRKNSEVGDSRVTELTHHFAQLHEFYRNFPLTINYAAWGSVIKRLLKTYKPRAIRGVMKAFFETPGRTKTSIYDFEKSFGNVYGYLYDKANGKRE